MTAFRINYEGPASLAVRAATLLADAEGVELTSSQPPEHRDGAADLVVLALSVEGTADAVLDAVRLIGDDLAPEATFVIVNGG